MLGKFLCLPCGQWLQLESSIYGRSFEVIFCQECYNKSRSNRYLFSNLVDSTLLEEVLEGKRKEIQNLRRSISDYWRENSFRHNVFWIMNALLHSFSVYAVFHGHRIGQDCWLCPYRGFFAVIIFLWFLWSFAGINVVERIWDLLFEGKSEYLSDSDDEVSIISRQSSQSEKSDDEEPKPDDPPKSEDPRVNFARNLEEKKK